MFRSSSEDHSAFVNSQQFSTLPSKGFLAAKAFHIVNALKCFLRFLLLRLMIPFSSQAYWLKREWLSHRRHDYTLNFWGLPAAQLSPASSEPAGSQDHSKSGSEAGPGLNAVSLAVAIFRIYQCPMENKSLKKIEKISVILILLGRKCMCHNYLWMLRPPCQQMVLHDIKIQVIVQYGNHLGTVGWGGYSYKCLPAYSSCLKFQWNTFIFRAHFPCIINHKL